MALRRRTDAPRRSSSATTAARGSAARPRGFGDGARFTVKGSRPTAHQRRTLDECLAEAFRLGCSRRVMVAVVVTVVQESNAGEDRHTGDYARADTIGAFQQGPEWISPAQVHDNTLATRTFLLGHEADGFSGSDRSKRGWKQWHGGLKAAPGDLGDAIQTVQRSDPRWNYLLRRYVPEAERTVDAWLGGAEPIGGAGGGDTRYEFTRGERRGSRETSWDAAGRLAEEVRAARWAVGNVVYYASDDELNAAAPSAQVNGDEPWLVTLPSLSWGSQRLVTETSFTALAERWSMLPGAVVVIGPTLGALQGRWLVHSVSGQQLGSPVVTVALRRPLRQLAEPAAERLDSDPSSTARSAGQIQGTAASLRAACQAISDQGLPYAWGGGHGSAGTPSQSIRPGETQVGYDCSGSVGAALALARVGGWAPGRPVPGSGSLDAWGRAGEGEHWTIWANNAHVFIQFADGWRFDTSGGPPSGPRMRQGRRSTAGFYARHF